MNNTDTTYGLGHDLPVDDAGYYGLLGGAYIPEIFYRNVENL